MFYKKGPIVTVNHLLPHSPPFPAVPSDSQENASSQDYCNTPYRLWSWVSALTPSCRPLQSWLFLPHPLHHGHKAAWRSKISTEQEGDPWANEFIFLNQFSHLPHLCYSHGLSLQGYLLWQGHMFLIPFWAFTSRLQCYLFTLTSHYHSWAGNQWLSFGSLCGLLLQLQFSFTSLTFLLLLTTNYSL